MKVSYQFLPVGGWTSLRRSSALLAFHSWFLSVKASMTEMQRIPVTFIIVITAFASVPNAFSFNFTIPAALLAPPLDEDEEDEEEDEKDECKWEPTRAPVAEASPPTGLTKAPALSVPNMVVLDIRVAHHLGYKPKLRGRAKTK